MHNKSQRRVFMEILIGGVVGGVVMSALTLGVFRLLINADYQSAAFVVSSVYVGVIVVVMMALAVFIFFKLKDSRVRAKNEFQRLVGVVSVVYCLFQVNWQLSILTTTLLIILSPNLVGHRSTRKKTGFTGNQ